MSDSVQITEMEIVEEWRLRFWFGNKGGRIHERRYDDEAIATHAAKNLWSIYDDVITVIEKVTLRQSVISREEVMSATPVRSAS